MDDVISKVKGTGKSEIQLGRRIAEKRTFPSINNINRRSGHAQRVTHHGSRRAVQDVDRASSCNYGRVGRNRILVGQMKDTKTHPDFFDAMKLIGDVLPDACNGDRVANARSILSMVGLDRRGRHPVGGIEFWPRRMRSF